MPLKNGMLQLYQQLINTGFTSTGCNRKKVQYNILMEDDKTLDLQIKFQKSEPLHITLILLHYY